MLVAIGAELDDETLKRVLVSLLALALPLALATFFARQCGSQTRQEWRCLRKREGLFRRCQDHTGINLYDVLSVACAMIFALTLGSIVMGVTNHGA